MKIKLAGKDQDVNAELLKQINVAAMEDRNNLAQLKTQRTDLAATVQILEASPHLPKKPDVPTQPILITASNPKSYNEYVKEAESYITSGGSVLSEEEYKKQNPIISKEQANNANLDAKDKYKKELDKYQSELNQYREDPAVKRLKDTVDKLNAVDKRIATAIELKDVNFMDKIQLEHTDFGQDNKLKPEIKSQMKQLSIGNDEIEKIENTRAVLMRISKEIDGLLQNPALNAKERGALNNFKEDINKVYPAGGTYAINNTYSANISTLQSSVITRQENAKIHFGDVVQKFFVAAGKAIAAAFSPSAKASETFSKYNVNAADEIGRFKKDIKDIIEITKDSVEAKQVKEPGSNVSEKPSGPH